MKFRKTILSAAEVFVKENQRKVEIIDIITRENLPSLFVVAYRDTRSKNHYLFYKEELIFAKNLQYKPAA